MRAASFALFVALLCVAPSSSYAQWVQTAGPETGTASVFALNPANAHLFAIAGRSLYRSVDAGATWTPLFGGLLGNSNLTTVWASGNNAWVGATGSLGEAFYSSANEGDTWTLRTATGLPPGGIVSCVLLRGTTLVAGVSGIGSSGIYVSTDNGDTWSPSGLGLPVGVTIGYLVAQGTDLYAGSHLTSGVKGIYRSTDGAVTWTPTNTPWLAGTTSLDGVAANANGVYATTNLSGIYRTVDGGANWPKVSSDVTSNFATCIVASPSAVYAGIAGGRVYKADASGNGWGPVNNGLPPPNNGVSVTAVGVSGTSVVCGFGSYGVYRSTDAGANWSRSSTGLRASRINGMLADGADVFAAADAGGFYRGNADGSAWTEIDNGVTPYTGWYGFARTGSALLGGSGNGQLWRSTDRGDSWVPSNGGINLTGTFVITPDPANPAIVYAGGYHDIDKSVDFGQTWTPLNAGFSFTQTVLDLWKKGSVIIAGASVGVKRSIDDGATWTAPLVGLPGGGGFGAIASLGGSVFMTTSFDNVYRSDDDGANWVPANAGLTGTASSLLGIGGDLFAGTSDGVFMSTDGGDTWSPIDAGLPPHLNVTKLAANGTYLFAGTFQNGVWRRPLYELDTTPVATSLVFARAGERGVSVRWFTAPDRAVTIERRAASDAWTLLRSDRADARGYVTLDDPGVAAGGRYAYRLGWMEQGRSMSTAEVWVSVPGLGGLQLLGSRPNPAPRDFAIAFTLPAAARVRLELIDLAGRRAGPAVEADLTAGTHQLASPAWRMLPAGIYMVTLTAAGESRTARIVITH